MFTTFLSEVEGEMYDIDPEEEYKEYVESEKE